MKPLTVDEELERRKARAAKWGTEIKPPAVAEPAPAASEKLAKPTKIVPAAPAVDVGLMCLGTASHSHNICPQDTEKIKERQARFGIKESTKSTTAPVADEAEARKRKAREERFGSNPGVRVVCSRLSSTSDNILARSQKTSHWSLSLR